MKPYRLDVRSLILTVSLLVAGCSVSEPPAPADTTVTVAGQAFYSLGWQARWVHTATHPPVAEIQADLQAALDAVNRRLSTYQPDTELMQLNAAPVGDWFPVSAALAETLRVAQRVSTATEGAYDITVGPLVSAWGFGPDARPEKIPSTAEIARLQQFVGWQRFTVDDRQPRVLKQQSIQLDASSLGEGSGVAAMAAVMARHGIDRYLLSVAGVSRGQGRRLDGHPWRVAIEEPDGSGRPRLGIPLTNGHVSTSGSYRNYFERDGQRYSHTIDPRTGRPITHQGVSATVVDPEGTWGAEATDAWATAAQVLGPEAALALAEREGLALYVLEHTASGLRARASAAFDALTTPAPQEAR